MAITVPIQKLRVGLFFKKKNAPIPTQTGERLVSKVACVAVDSWIEIFHTVTSNANIKPQSMVSINNFTEGIFIFPATNVKGTSTAAAIAIL